MISTGTRQPSAVRKRGRNSFHVDYDYDLASQILTRIRIRTGELGCDNLIYELHRSARKFLIIQ
ncbi:MAG TPA: hypothetical protein VND64_04485 [Pirellulales bacterium]|nr:hypothetical protein [Pirellulales bacterium]